MEKAACLENGLAGLQLLDDPEAPPTSNQEGGEKKSTFTHKSAHKCSHLQLSKSVSNPMLDNNLRTSNCGTTIVISANTI